MNSTPSAIICLQIAIFILYLCFHYSFLENIARITRGELKATLILNDPAGNSYVQALTDDGSLDDRLKIEKYERSYDQNEELGLNDMKTENYETTS